MELHQIKSFVTVAKTGNLTRAARRLNTTPPSVSAHIRQLEDEFGVILFSRTPKGMILTRAGEGLAQKAEAILGATGEFSRAALELGGEIKGNLTLGINADPVFLKIEPLVHTLYETHPGLSIEVVPSNTRAILDLVASGKMDMGFVFGPWQTPGLTFLPLSRVDLEIVVPSGFDRSIETAGWEEIARLPWIQPVTCCPLLDQVRAALAKRKLTLENQIRANDDITKAALINRGVALTVLERSEALRLERAGIIFFWKGKEPLSTRISLAFSTSRAGLPEISTLARTIKGIWKPEGA